MAEILAAVVRVEIGATLRVMVEVAAVVAVVVVVVGVIKGTRNIMNCNLNSGALYCSQISQIYTETSVVIRAICENLFELHPFRNFYP